MCDCDVGRGTCPCNEGREHTEARLCVAQCPTTGAVIVVCSVVIMLC